jgi:hypothetical protein
MFGQSKLEVTMNLYENFLLVQQNIRDLEKLKKELESEIYLKFKGNIESAEAKTFNCIDNGFKVKITQTERWDVDQEMAANLGGSCFKVKYSLDKKAYNEMDIADRELVNNAITVFPLKPSFSIERL